MPLGGELGKAGTKLRVLGGILGKMTQENKDEKRRVGDVGDSWGGGEKGGVSKVWKILSGWEFR